MGICSNIKAVMELLSTEKLRASLISAGIFHVLVEQVVYAVCNARTCTPYFISYSAQEAYAWAPYGTGLTSKPSPGSTNTAITRMHAHVPKAAPLATKTSATGSGAPWKRSHLISTSTAKSHCSRTRIYHEIAEENMPSTYPTYLYFLAHRPTT